ncbi:MAG: type II toxin-antitoxin system prevent-host-death family antitoxin [Pyrinomonadaceae bacterium]|nr:type II toxin-antitoxin system prevent-host-death family antitoxin [Pyrinomonadaceae bacterium]
MTKTVTLNEAQTQLRGLLALARNSNEIIIEENGEPLAKITPIEKPKEQKQRVAGLGKGTI